ncbi:MAG TPA: His/Gly/Thr/Pro-type tRNA ligase C-terminal domain-containing protein, partial [Chthoniobacteraceae bacterium]|nr:His/Gly/Thr/Pro-type tRNA ligase C-terminal domain-containing protein [Chthoniobacteraceae bacterium]
LVGTLIMAHADDDGMVLPPRVAPAQIVILPVTPKPETREAVLAAVEQLASDLRAQSYAGEPIRVEVDKRDIGGGQKSWEWIKKGVPIRVEIGPRDLEKGSVAVARRDRGPKEKAFIPTAEFVAQAATTLTEIQQTLLDRAIAYREANTLKIDTKEEFYRFFTATNPEKPEIHGGFALAHWNGTREVEDRIKEELKVTIRCIPLDAPEEDGRCILTGEPSRRRVVWAKSY